MVPLGMEDRKGRVELTRSGWTPSDFFRYADLMSFSLAAGVSPRWRYGSMFASSWSMMG